jgi:uncharacterized protein YbjT (DUF2867 family)
MACSRRAPTTDDAEILVTLKSVPPVLVIGATGRVGRAVVDLLVDAGVSVRALTRRSEAGARLPANVEVVTGDLTVPESLDAGLRGVGAVFLVWTGPPTTAAAVVERLATYARRVVFLSAPHQTPHPFFQQPNPMAVLYAEIERLIASTGLESTIIRPGVFASNALHRYRHRAVASAIADGAGPLKFRNAFGTDSRRKPVSVGFCRTHDRGPLTAYALVTGFVLAGGRPDRGCPRRDSNARSRLRRAVLYPLSYGGSATSNCSRTGARGLQRLPPRAQEGNGFAPNCWR